MRISREKSFYAIIAIDVISMNVGTKSFLFGAHQFVLHPLLVFVAWCKIYGFPNWKTIFCIIIHDFGYFGCSEIDGEDGAKHPEFAANIAGKLFGINYYSLVLLHSRFYANECGVEPSKLCWADKYGMILENTKFYVFRARLSGELKEYRKNWIQSGTDEEWFEKCKTVVMERIREFVII